MENYIQPRFLFSVVDKGLSIKPAVYGSGWLTITKDDRELFTMLQSAQPAAYETLEHWSQTCETEESPALSCGFPRNSDLPATTWTTFTKRLFGLIFPGTAARVVLRI
jgi:hypothetical protein